MRTREYSDFRVEIDLDSDHCVNVSVVSRHGETTEPVSVPLRSGELAAMHETASRLMDRGLLPDELVRFGQRLARMLLPVEAREVLFRALNAAGETSGVRLRLVANHEELSALPWEYVYVNHPTDHSRLSPFVALDPRVSVVRHERQDVPVPSVRPFRTEHFRLLVAPATAVPGWPSLGDADDVAIREALAAASDDLSLEIVTLPDPVDRETLREALREQFDAFQFVGHGQEPEAGEAGCLLVAGPDGAEAIPATELAGWLREADVRIAVLSSCHSGRRDPEDRWGGTASALVRAGIPAVVAMQHMIESSHALAFEQGFYGGLAAGLTLDEAVAVGRRKINDLGILASWGVPVLYSRSDGHIFVGSRDREQVAAQLRSSISERPLDLSEGFRLESLGNWSRSVAFYERQLDRAVSKREVVVLTLRLGGCLWRDGRVEDAKERLDDARHLAGELGDNLLLGEVLLELATLLEESDQLHDASRRYEEALPLLASSPMHQVRGLLGLASLQRRRGELRTALLTLDSIDEDSLPAELQAEFEDAYGAVLVARGQYRDAVDTLTRALALDENLEHADSHRTASSRLLLAEAHLGCGRRAEAQAEVEAAIEIYEKAHDESGLSEAWVLRGQIYEDAGEYQKALRAYQRASTFDAAGEDKGGEARAYRLLGRTARKRGDLDTAEEYFENARRLLGRSHDDLELAALATEEGLLDLDEGNYADAITHFQRALEIAEKDEDDRAVAVAKRNLASALYESGDLHGALDLLLAARPVLEERGDTRELEALLDDLGEVFLDLSEHGRAIEALTESEKLDNDLDNGRGRGRTQLLLGRAYLSMGRREKAASYLQAALETYEELEDKVGCSDALFELGRWAADEGHAKAALEHLTRALRIDRKQEDRLGIVRCHRVLASVLRRNGDWMRAADHLLDARAELGNLRDPMESALLVLERAQLELVKGDNSEAIDLAREARQEFEQLRVPEPAAQCDRISAKAYAAQGETERALVLLDAARATFERLGAVSELSETYDDMAEIYLLRGELVLARDAVEASLVRDRDRETVWRSSQGRSLMIKGDIEKRGGRADAALDLFEQALSHFSENESGQAEVHLRIGAWYLEHGGGGQPVSLEHAAKAFKDARRLFQKHQDMRGMSRALRGLGEVYFARHEFERAEEAFEQAEEMLGALRSDPERAPLHVAQGALMAAKGSYSRAVDHFERALHLFRQMRREDRVNDVLRRLATAHQNNGDLESALDCIRQIGLERARLWNVLLENLDGEIVETCGPAYRDGRYDRAVESAVSVATGWLRAMEREAAPGSEPSIALLRTAMDLLGQLLDDSAWQPSSVEALAALSVVHLASPGLTRGRSAN